MPYKIVVEILIVIISVSLFVTIAFPNIQSYTTVPSIVLLKKIFEPAFVKFILKMIITFAVKIHL